MYRFNASGTGEEAAWPYYDPSSKAVNDPNAAVDRIGKILAAGIPLSRTYVYETIEAPIPGDDDELFESADDDKVYPKALALTSMVSNGLPISQSFAYNYMGFPAPANGEALVEPPTTANPLSPLVAKALDGMPTASREYFLAAIKSAAAPL